MGGFAAGLLFSLLVIAASASSEGHLVRARESPVTCSSDGVVCEFSESNLLDQVPEVHTLDQCRELCLDVDSCQYISYFDQYASPVSDFCQLFKTCDSVNNCSNCYTENIDCQTCGTNVRGGLNENVQDVIPYIESEMECKKLCLMNSTCTFYTYFMSNDTLFHQNCFLLTHFVSPAQSCSDCITGPVDCECSLTMDGESSQSLMLTRIGGPNQITIWGDGSCHLKFLVVGGGGRARYGGQFFGGAGSGAVGYYSEKVTPGTVLTAWVGDQRQNSSVSVNEGWHTFTLTAFPGEDGQSYLDGGDGYSGGGGGGSSYGGDGGTDGGDGEEDGSSGSGGRGDGHNIPKYFFRTWSLGAGAGGQHFYSTSDNGFGGGGGGGVMVDGAGPQGSRYQGAGYGGGGSGLATSSHGDGLQGVILIELN